MEITSSLWGRLGVKSQLTRKNQCTQNHSRQFLSETSHWRPTYYVPLIPLQEVFLPSQSISLVEGKSTRWMTCPAIRALFFEKCNV